MNTRIDFTYRDVSNDKTRDRIVVAGAPSPALLVRLAATLEDYDAFGPLDVGIEPIWGSFDPELDHNLHEFEIVDADNIHGWDGDTAGVAGDSPAVYGVPTDQKPTDPRTLEQLVEAFEQAAAAKWLSLAMSPEQARGIVAHQPAPTPLAYTLSVTVDETAGAPGTLDAALHTLAPVIAAMNQADRRDKAALTHVNGEVGGEVGMFELEFTVVVDARDDEDAWRVVGPLSVMLDSIDATGDSDIDGPVAYDPDVHDREHVAAVTADDPERDLFDAPSVSELAETLLREWPNVADVPVDANRLTGLLSYDYSDVRAALDGYHDIVIAPGANSDDEGALDAGMEAFDDHLNAAMQAAYGTSLTDLTTEEHQRLAAGESDDRQGRLADPKVAARAVRALTRVTSAGKRRATNIVSGQQPLDEALPEGERELARAVLFDYEAGQASVLTVTALLAAALDGSPLEVAADGRLLGVTCPYLDTPALPLVRTTRWDAVVSARHEVAGVIHTGLDAEHDDALTVAQRIAKIVVTEAIRLLIDLDVAVSGRERRTVGALADVFSDEAQRTVAADAVRGDLTVAQAAALTEVAVRLHGGETRLADLGL